MNNKLTVYCLLLIGLLSLQSLSVQADQTVMGNMRIQALSENLIRIEQKGPKGFENRHTFTVIERSWPGEKIKIQKQENHTILTTTKFRMEIPHNCRSLKGIIVQLIKGKDRFQFKGIPETDYIPGPVNKPEIWILPDHPRMVPPEWGATPPPEKYRDDPHSGWDISNNAQDVYVFLVEPDDYQKFRKDFLKLTGPVPMPPLYAFGLWDSRYHPYTEESALQTIDTYREKQIPLDVFVVDTDWRVGASHGYTINDSLFPDMERFIRRAHDRNVRLMYNDHPEPQAETALAPGEIQYRWDGLTKLFDMGIDIWWYDRNWYTGLHEPMPGISKEVWGMRLYHDITQEYYPEKRPLIMSNVDGIDNGFWNYPSHPASHRFPIWWTGDQKSSWEFLEMGVANGVNSGIHRMMPYVSEDLGGHTGGNPDPEQYVRWVQYGVFSPIARLHCTRGLTRYPWEYGQEAEHISAEYIRMRYRLLPVLYAAARRAYENGTPMMQRCDLEWPDQPEADREKQYLFGEDLLVAPIALAKTRDIPLNPGLFKTSDGQAGLRGEYFNNQDLQGEPVFVRRDTNLNFIWGSESPDPRISANHFSVRWTGTIYPSDESSSSRFKVISDDGVRVWIQDSLVVDGWRDQAPTDYPVRMKLNPGQSYPLKIEFYENAGGAHLQFMRTVDVEQIYQLWIPPGSWQDIWTGKIMQGPDIVTIHPVLWKCPIYVRNGGLVFSLPQMQYTSKHAWNKVIIDAFVPVEDTSGITRILYEDDGISPAYQQGSFCKTPVIQSRQGNKVQLTIEKMKGDYKGSVSLRDWIIRFNLPPKTQPQYILVNGKTPEENPLLKQQLITKPETREGIMPFRSGARPRPEAGSVLEIYLTQQNTRTPIQISFKL
ncbi:MAG: glycoside hydrolase family 31 protein [bacterium]